MEPHFIPISGRADRASIFWRWVIDGLLVILVVFIPNLLVALYYGKPVTNAEPLGLLNLIALRYSALPIYAYAVWGCVNIAIAFLLLIVRRAVVLPLSHITQHLHQLHGAYNHEIGRPVTHTLNIARLAVEVGRFAAFALEHYRKHQELAVELQQARQVIAQFSHTQATILKSTNREIAQQYRSVLAYANYLEERIASTKLDPTLRFDLDDIVESSFNLKLIAGALNMLSATPGQLTNVPLAPVMQQTILALAPALDRRSMKLTTTEVDMAVAARGDPEILAQILWMMLLGMIRYAADESTMRIRCLHNREGTQALLSIVVSELSATTMSEEERSDYLVRHLQHLTPHMFAETIRIHGNVQLADLLLKRINGTISVLPLTVSSCEICMVLPSAEIASECY